MSKLQKLQIEEIYTPGFIDRIWYDEERGRELPVAIWYPSSSIKSSPIHYLQLPSKVAIDGELANGSFPLVVVSHGIQGHRFNQYYIAEHLAKKGHIVAAVEHSHDNYLNDDMTWTRLNLINRPKDITFVIDKLLCSDEIGNAIDSNRIGALGHSFGGYTVLAASGAVLDMKLVITYFNGMKTWEAPGDTSNTKHRESSLLESLKDDRIKATTILAPGLVFGFSRETLKNIKIPFCILYAEHDEVLSNDDNAKFCHKYLGGESSVHMIESAGHYVFLPKCTSRQKKIVPEICFDPGPGRETLHPEIIELVTNFFLNKL